MILAWRSKRRSAEQMLGATATTWDGRRPGRCRKNLPMLRSSWQRPLSRRLAGGGERVLVVLMGVVPHSRTLASGGRSDGDVHFSRRSDGDVPFSRRSDGSRAPQSDTCYFFI